MERIQTSKPSSSIYINICQSITQFIKLDKIFIKVLKFHLKLQRWGTSALSDFTLIKGLQHLPLACTDIVVVKVYHSDLPGFSEGSRKAYK